jgi:hypothetical protein
MGFLQRSDDKFIDDAMDDLKRPFAIDQFSRACRGTFWSSRGMLVVFLGALILAKLNPSPSSFWMVGLLGFAAVILVITDMKMRSDLRLLKIVDRLRVRSGGGAVEPTERGAGG